MSATVLVPTTPSQQTTPPSQRLITAEEFVEKYSHQYAELIRGELKEYGMPSGRHGQVCLKTGRLIGNYVEQHNLGHTCSNDTSLLIRRNPDTVRGPDICYFSFSRIPPGPLPETVLEAIPELTCEVRSPSNTWTEIFGKIGDYLRRGVTAVLVLDPDGLTASVYRESNGQVVFHMGDTLTLPDVLPGFAVPVAKFFE
jgi:Uma2 family endonuclease